MDNQAFSNDNKVDESTYLYDKTVTCPVCGNTFKVRAVKKSSYRILKQDSDFFIEYGKVNAYFYDVWLCNNCGYAAMHTDFNKIRESEKQLILSKISSKWHHKNYPNTYNLNIAIERFKLSLLSYTALNASSSKMGMNCLKLAWMYRLNENNQQELSFLKKALESFLDAYTNESFPIYGLSKFAMLYLLGELHRRVGNNEEALLWFGRLMAETNADQKLKNKAKDQKDLIKSLQKESVEPMFDNDKKKGIFSNLFK